MAIGILDTGIDLNHPDLAVDLSRGLNCTGAGPPEDMHGHGTHVAGIAAATADNGIGVVGIAPEAVVVPIKVLDDTGEGTDSTVICGVDYLTGLATDGDPTNDVRIANLSLGEQGVIGHCQDGGLRQAICTSVEAGVTYVAAAGNSSIDAAEFIPAAYPEVVTVSALTDLDGEPGGLGGCYFFVLCDDDLAFFSNVGPIVDVIAPGVQILSTWKGDSYSTSDGTSMAAPHVAGVAALITAANPALAPADIERVLKAGGECPDGTWADGGSSEFDCQGQGSWDGDPDPEAEPLINALRSAQA
ncbi:MAG: S8 family serine peptidase, partial [Candidatus Limnocylindria bacterium]